MVVVALTILILKCTLYILWGVLHFVWRVCRFKSWFSAAMDGVEKHLVRLSEPSKLTFVGELRGGSQFYAKMVSAPLCCL